MISGVKFKVIDNLEGLSEAIIDTLVSMSADRKPLSVSFLSHALGKRNDIRNLMAMVHPGNRANGDEPDEPDKKERTAETETIPDPTSNLREGVEEHESNLRLSDFLRRSLSTVINLVDVNENGEVLERLDGLKKTVMTCSEIEPMEKCLDLLKQAITQPEDSKVEDSREDNNVEAPRAVSGPSLWDKLLKRKQQPDTRTVDFGGNHLNEIQNIFLSVVAEFDQDLGEDYAGHCLKLRANIQNSTNCDYLLSLKDDLLLFLQAYNRIMNEERNQITDFLSEIGGSLIEVESLFLNSMTQNEQVYSQNNSFNSLLDSQMEDMKKSAQLSSTLAEFKSLVISRLAAIRTALEEKRRTETLREETLNVEVQHLQQSLSRMKKEIDDVHEKRKALEKEILIDQLTGIANRRALKRRLKDELQRYQRYQQFFSIILFDIDHFKSINDRYGHWAGDKCLKEIIKRIKPILRETDFLARWGGEEFIILFPGTDIDNASAVAERLRKTIENTRFLYHKQEISLTVSIGVTKVQQTDHGQETIFTRVDKAMYEAKRKGRNRVVIT